MKTPKEKAIELIEKFYPQVQWKMGQEDCMIRAKKCALIAVDEILDALFVIPDSMRYMGGPTYWIEVKKKLE